MLSLAEVEVSRFDNPLARESKRGRSQFTRRGFLEAMAAGTVSALLPSAGYSVSSGIPDKIDIRPQLEKNQRIISGSQCQDIVYSGGIKQGFRGHLNRPIRNYGMAGLDFPPQGETTILAPDTGILTRIDSNHPHNGGEFVIYLGLGFNVMTSHIEKINEKFFKKDGTLWRDVTVERGEPIGQGTHKTAPGVGKNQHIHLTLLGPIYAKSLERIDLQEYESKQGKIYPIDPEPFSPQGKCIPKFASDALTREHSLYRKAQSVDFSIDESLRSIDRSLIPENDRIFYDRLLSYRDSSKSQWYQKNKGGIDFYLDQKLDFLYKLAKKSDHPSIRKAGEEAVALMSTRLPILTSPVAKN